MLPGKRWRAGRSRKTATSLSGSMSAIFRTSRWPSRFFNSRGPLNAFSILTCWSRTRPIRRASGSVSRRRFASGSSVQTIGIGRLSPSHAPGERPTRALTPLCAPGGGTGRPPADCGTHQPRYRLPLYTPVQKPGGPPSRYEPGSAADFDRLYRLAYPRVCTEPWSPSSADPTEAEDCTQDAFVKAFQAWKRWRPDAPAEAWIHRIAVNSAISYRRRARLRSVGEVIRRLGRPSAGGDPADVAVQPDMLRALRILPPKLAAAIVLRHYHGYNNREIAASLGVSERTVGTRLRQGRGAPSRRTGTRGGSWRPSHLRRRCSVVFTHRARDVPVPTPEDEMLSPGLKTRLQAALDEVAPPSPSLASARYRMRAAKRLSRAWRFAPALVAIAAAGGALTATAATGSPNPAVWRDRAGTVIENVSHFPSSIPKSTNRPKPDQKQTPAPDRKADRTSSGATRPSSHEPKESPLPQERPEPGDGAEPTPTPGSDGGNDSSGGSQPSPTPTDGGGD